MKPTAWAVPRMLRCGNARPEPAHTLGANCTIVCGVTIGEFAFIGAVINKDVKPCALVVGVTARQIGWMSEHGEQMPLPLEGGGRYSCPHTGIGYELSNGQIRSQKQSASG